MSTKDNKKTTKEILAELDEAIEFSNEVAELCKKESYIDEGSYEEYRDTFRFMTRVFVFLMGLSFLCVLASTASLATKEEGKIYMTSRGGDVEEITSIKRR